MIQRQNAKKDRLAQALALVQGGAESEVDLHEIEDRITKEVY